MTPPASRRTRPPLEAVVRDITALVVHCSATPQGKTFTAADIDRWHREKGWERIGYHFVIGLTGTIELGRPVDVPGAHVTGHNAKTIGICLIGGVDAAGKLPQDTFTPAQRTSLALVLRGLRASFPLAVVCGHRDFPKVAKACPSFDVAAWARSVGIEP